MATNSVPPTQGANPAIKNPVLPAVAKRNAVRPQSGPLLDILQAAVDQFLVSPTDAARLKTLQAAAAHVKAKRWGSAI